MEEIKDNIKNADVLAFCKDPQGSPLSCVLILKRCAASEVALESIRMTLPTTHCTSAAKAEGLF